MPKEARLFAKFALDFPDSRKVLPLSDSAFRCLVEAIIWSCKERSDGWLASRLALAKWSLDDLQELSTNDPENPSLIAYENGWKIHGFTDIQESKAEIDARRERNRAAGQKGGLAKAKQVGKQRAKRTVSEVLSENVADKDKDKDLTTNVVRSRPTKRNRRLPDNWMPPQNVIDAIKAECPGVNLETEHRKFIDHFTGNGKTMADWTACWRNWMRRSGEFTRNSDTRPVADRRVAETQALKLVQPSHSLELS